MTKISFINKDCEQQGASLCGSVLFNVRKLAIKSVTVFQNSFPPSSFGKWSHYLFETFWDNHRKIGHKFIFYWGCMLLIILTLFSQTCVILEIWPFLLKFLHENRENSKESTKTKDTDEKSYTIYISIFFNFIIFVT